MEKVVNRLKRNYCLTLLCIVGALMLLVEGAVFFLTYNSTQRTIEESMDRTLRSVVSPSEGPIPVELTNCITIIVTDTKIYYQKLDYYTEEDIRQIVESVLLSKGDRFSVNNRDFRMKSIDLSFGRCYAVYDCTLENETIENLLAYLLLIYVCGIAVFAVIAAIIAGKAVQPVREAFQQQKELTENISHELKTPLTIISTDLDLLQAWLQENQIFSGQSEQQKWMESANTQTKRMDQLIREMLSLSRLESGGVIEKVQKVDAVHLLEGVLLNFEVSCYEKGVRLEQNLQPTELYTKPQALERIFTILMDNALKYTPRNGYIDVKMAHKKSVLQVSFRNSGMGIGEMDREKIFERFYKAESSRTVEEDKSFGLGLSIAKNLTESLQGKIQCESNAVEQYVEFIVTIPMKISM